MDRRAWRDRVAQNLGRDPELVDADFDRMLNDQCSFDRSETWPLLQATIMEYERWVVVMEEESKARRVERVARALGDTIGETEARLSEIEALLGKSLDDPVELAKISVALLLYRLHADKLPPLGDPAWAADDSPT